MSFSLDAIKVLKKAGYNEITIDTPVTGRLAHIVYLIANDDTNDIWIYDQSTRAVRSNFTRFQQFLKHGKATRLPVPVQNKVTFSFVQFPEYHVKAYYKKDIFTNATMMVKLRGKGCMQCPTKERDTGPLVNVYKISLPDDPRFRVVTSKFSSTKVASQIASKAKEQIMATYDTRAFNFRSWAWDNRDRMEASNLVVETLVEGMYPAPARAFMLLTLEGADKQNLLNCNHI